MKKQPKVTPWFARSVKPVRKGFYDYKYCHSGDYTFNARWTGARWLIYDKAYPNANGEVIASSARDEWRGLAADPKAAA